MADQPQIKPINRLIATREVRAALDRMYSEAIEASKDGAPTAWSMVNWWHADPILKAMDFVILYPENYGAVCAATGAAQEFLSRCESEWFPTHLCGYARNCIGYTQKMMELGEIPSDAPLGGMPKPNLLLSSSLFCDARFKWFQSLGRYMKVPVWVMEVPHPRPKESLMEGVFEYSIKFMVEELRNFVEFLERIRGKKLDWDLLAELVQTQEKVLKIWYEINELRQAVPCPMHSRDFWTNMVPCYFMAWDNRSYELYKKILQEVKERINNEIGSIGSGNPSEEKYRLAFVELPPWHTLKFFDRLAERGWNFVIETWSYHPPPPLDLEGINDPLERIARQTYWFYTNQHKNAVKGNRSAGAMVEPFVQYASQYKLDGALIHPLISCRCNAVFPLHIRDVLQNDALIPSMVMPGDIVDLRVFDETQVLNQTEAFMETMEYYRDLRKKKGLNY